MKRFDGLMFRPVLEADDDDDNLETEDNTEDDTDEAEDYTEGQEEEDEEGDVEDYTEGVEDDDSGEDYTEGEPQEVEPEDYTDDTEDDSDDSEEEPDNDTDDDSDDSEEEPGDDTGGSDDESDDDLDSDSDSDDDSSKKIEDRNMQELSEDFINLYNLVVGMNEQVSSIDKTNMYVNSSLSKIQSNLNQLKRAIWSHIVYDYYTIKYITNLHKYNQFILATKAILKMIEKTGEFVEKN